MAQKTYLDVIEANRSKLDRDADVVVLHDPEPLGLADYRDDCKGKFLWRCYIDTSRADPATWYFLQRFLNRCDGAIYHLPEYSRELAIEQFTMTPAIDPFAPKIGALAHEQVRAQSLLPHYLKRWLLILLAVRYPQQARDRTVYGRRRT